MFDSILKKVRIVIFRLGLELVEIGHLRSDAYSLCSGVKVISFKSEDIGVLNSNLLRNFKILGRAILKTVSLDEIKKILTDFIIRDCWEDIFVSNFRSLKGSVKWIKEQIKEMWSLGAKKYLKLKYKNSVRLFSSVFGSLESFIRSIRDMTFNEILLFGSKVLLFFCAAFLGYKIPDLDITLWGIGAHRHWLSHSVAPVIAVSLLSKLIRRFVERIGGNCKDCGLDIDSPVSLISSLVNTFSIGISTGVAFHLSKDLMFDGSQTIRGPWRRDSIPDFLRTNYRFDDGYLFLNQLGSITETTKS